MLARILPAWMLPTSWTQPAPVEESTPTPSTTVTPPFEHEQVDEDDEVIINPRTDLTTDPGLLTSQAQPPDGGIGPPPEEKKNEPETAESSSTGSEQSDLGHPSSVTMDITSLTSATPLQSQIPAESDDSIHDHDSDTPLLQPQHVDVRPPIDYRFTITTTLSNRAFYVGIYVGVTSSLLSSSITPVPLLVQIAGASITSAAGSELLLAQASKNNSALNKEQARKDMLFKAVGATAATTTLLYVFSGPIGFWVVPMLIVGAKIAVPHVQPFARNASNWWQGKAKEERERKKFDGAELTRPERRGPSSIPHPV